MNRAFKVIAKNIRNKLDFVFCHNKFRIAQYNSINYGKNTRYRYCKIIVHGKNNKLIIGEDCNLCGLNIAIDGDNNTIILGNGVSVNASKIKPTVINARGGTSISIGKDSLLSNNIEIHSTDYHGIYDKNGDRINPDKDIYIGDNVWIGLGCIILKGSYLPSGTIVGAGSVVSGSFSEENVVIAGRPSRIIKREVFWQR